MGRLQGLLNMLEILSHAFDKLPIALPCQKVCQSFMEIFKTSPQRAIDYLCRCYRIPNMKIIKEKLVKDLRACYGDNVALVEEEFDIEDILHEFYHHAVSYLTNQDRGDDFWEEIQADVFVIEVLKRAKGG